MGPLAAPFASLVWYVDPVSDVHVVVDPVDSNVTAVLDDHVCDVAEVIPKLPALVSTSEDVLVTVIAPSVSISILAVPSPDLRKTEPSSHAPPHPPA
mmetsp:Transcript_11036/g.38421  ORF Transcript_11036/g.38421 Transcript_11036/m.38421 type:complete len:97 (+) Transcript_11036:765-1055(+)